MVTSLQFIGLCNAELDAAQSAPTTKSRIRHSEQAFRYAKLAVAEGAKERALIRWRSTANQLAPFGPVLDG